MKTGATISTEQSSGPRPSASRKPWSGLRYEQVPGLANRLIARYLRTQRKTMTRFFTERGLLDLTEKMQRIRKSRQGMLAKNRMFREVLDEYAERVNPVSNVSSAGSGEAAGAAVETTDQPAVPVLDSSPADAVAMQAAGDAGTSGDGVHAGGSVSELASADGDELVIEE